MTTDEQYEAVRTELREAGRTLDMAALSDDSDLIREACDDYNELIVEYNVVNHARLTLLLEDAQRWLNLLNRTDDYNLCEEAVEYYDTIEEEFEEAVRLVRPEIPLAWINYGRLRAEHIQALQQVIEAYITGDAALIEEAWNNLTRAEYERRQAENLYYGYAEEEEVSDLDDDPYPNEIPNPYVNDEPKMAAAA